jgi:hypothetical protein
MKEYEDFYNSWDEENLWINNVEKNNERNKMDIAKDILDILENDDEVMDNFNFLLRQKKLKQLKENG